MPAERTVLALAVRRMDPGRARALRLLLPDFAWRNGWLQVPLGDESPEEVLAACCAVGLEIRESRVVRSAERG
jgi:hypothetical protein